MFGKLSTVAVVVVLLAGSTVVQASPVSPLEGTYGGAGNPSILDGRWTENYSGIGGAMMKEGNEFDGASWDATVLGGQWTLAGATLASVRPVGHQEIPVPGDGTIIIDKYFVVYTGGTVTLKDGPWTRPGEGDYTVDLTSFTQNITIFTGAVNTYSGDITMSGTVRDSGGAVMTYMAASTTVVGQGSSAPADYPALLAATGQWGSTSGAQMNITPEPATMGLLGLGALGMLIRRRRK